MALVQDPILSAHWQNKQKNMSSIVECKNRTYCKDERFHAKLENSRNLDILHRTQIFLLSYKN